MLDRQRAALDDCLAVLARYDVRVWTWNSLAEAEAGFAPTVIS